MTPEEQFDSKWDKRYLDYVKNSHDNPSPETRIELRNIKKEIASDKEAHNKIMDKLDKFGDKLEELGLKIAELPEAIFEKADERYANKKIEKEVEDIKNKSENRNYEWLKYLITLILGAVATIIISHFK